MILHCRYSASLKLHSKRVEKMQKYTRNEWRRCKSTLETSVVHIEGVQSWTSFSGTWSQKGEVNFLQLWSFSLHLEFRISIFSTRFECKFPIFSLDSSVFFPLDTIIGWFGVEIGVFIVFVKVVRIKLRTDQVARPGWNYTRNERRRCETTLETRGEDVKLHSKRVEKMLTLWIVAFAVEWFHITTGALLCIVLFRIFYTRNECSFRWSGNIRLSKPGHIYKCTLETSWEDVKVHSKPVGKI